MIPTTFSVYKDIDPRKYKRHEIAVSVMEAMSEFQDYKVATFELCGCYIAITQVQFQDSTEAAMFRLKYGSEWKAVAIENELFKEGHRTTYVGG